MNLVGLFLTITLCSTVIFAPRRWAFMGMMAGVLYLTENQAVDVFGLNLFAVRFLEIAGIIRVMLKRELTFSQLNRIDWALLVLYAYTTTVFLIRSSEGQAYQIGLAVDALLCYFTFRGLIRGIEELQWVLRALLFLLAPYAVIVSIEMITGHNPFTIIGGTEVVFFRGGRPRCMGSFRHPVLLGTLGASFFPLYVGLGFKKTDRVSSFVGILLCFWIIFLSNAGGAASSALIGIVGWCLWMVRARVNWVRRALVGVIFLLALVMKAPVWYLFARVSTITGGDGWHRSYLMDMAVKNFDSWWLAGMPIKTTADWFPYILRTTGGSDITNQYIGFGVSAGLIAIILFIFLLIQAFRSIGKSIRDVRAGLAAPDGTEPLLWGLGVCLLVHAVSWFGVVYFDQLYVVWFMQLALISNFSVRYVKPIEIRDSKRVRSLRRPFRKYGKNLSKNSLR